MTKLHVIVGSTREGRAAESVYRWVEQRAKEHGGFEVSVLDLRDWPLPFFQETFATLGDLADPTYSEPIVRRWNHTIKDGDAFIFVTPEYNHSFPAVLKNAIDSVFVSFGFRNKPIAFVGYSGGPTGGARAIEQLVQVVAEAEAVPLRSAVVLGNVGSAFDETGASTDKVAGLALDILLQDLAWWSSVLGQARAEGELIPGRFRMQAALAG